MNWDDCLQHAEVSDIGLRRATNQDAYAVVLAGDREAWQRGGHLLIVADGMGAHAAGELASEMAVAGIVHRYSKYSHLSAPEALQRAIQETNAEVHQRGQANPDFHNMGTTASVLVLLPQGAVVAHVGDSRVYRVRGRMLEQLTFDHSLVWELRQHGQFPAHADLASLVPKNIITRSLGPNPTVQIDFEGPFPIVVGDTFLLCSDGLTGLVPDEEIGPILATLPPQEAAQVLADLANLRGGHDNITVVVARVVDRSLATAGADGEPLTILRDHRPRPAGPLVWIAASVCGLAALAMAVLGQTIPALLALTGGGVTALVALWRRWGASSPGIELSAARRLGRGPHAQVACPVNVEFVGTLSSLVEQLRLATEGGDWRVDLEGFQRLSRQAQAATQAGHYDQALTHYVRAISYMMAELREQSRRTGQSPL